MTHMNCSATTRFVLATLLLTTFCYRAAGQELAQRQRPGSGSGPAQAMQAVFARSAPDVGQQLPDVAGYRSDGTKVSLRDLRGKYTVLVFGCLT